MKLISALSSMDGALAMASWWGLWDTKVGKVKQDMNLGGYLRYIVMASTGKITVTGNSSVNES